MNAQQKANQLDHHCIIQQSSNLILTVGETAQEAVTEYNNTYQEEKTVNSFSSSFHGNDDIILLPCTKFLHDKALSSGDETSYFYNGFEIDSYIETVEDFDDADTALSTEYSESSPCYVFFDSYSNIFNFKEFLLETAVNYDCPLEYDDISNITLELEAHFEDESTQDYDHVVFAKCTESNDYPQGEFKLDGESYYTLSFSRSDAVLILKK